jgi:outer membrane protein OmpA-like peptidoglycan-associated protein
MADDNPIETMTPGQILTDASVSEFIKAMGLSIAEAQKALDANSIAQVGEYVEPRPGLNGKSLLQLGLSPPFYHYQHADLSVSMQLTMKVGRTSAFGIGGKIDFGRTSGSTGGEARTAQVTLKTMPASVTVDGARTDAAGADLETAGESMAAKLRAPPGKFERAFVSARHTSPKAELEPGNAKNPILTPGAVAFLATEASSAGIIRIVDTPTANTSETFVLANGKTTEVASEANRLNYARKVVAQINALGGFKARLTQDPGGVSATPDAPGTLGIALFDTDRSELKREALDELKGVARLIKENGKAVNVTGYGDTRKDDDYNLKLGKARAEKVRDHLIRNGVPANLVSPASSGGEARWKDTPDNTANAQFRRVEVTLVGSTDLLIVVDSDGTQLQAKPTPDKTDGAAGNGFIVAKVFPALAVTGKKLKVGDAPTDVDIKGDAVATADTTLAEGTPDAFAFNLAKAVNDGSATHKVRAARRGNVVILSSADDAVTIDLVTISTDDIKLSAEGGAEITEPLKAIAPAAPAAAKPNQTIAVGVAVDYRTSRQFEQSVNGNSAINARLVAVPAPIEFLDEIRKFLGPDVRVTPDPVPVVTQTPDPAP